MDDLPTNRGPQVIALRWGLLAFVLLTLTLRLACRKISTQSFWWDDYLAIIGMAFCLADAINTTIAVQHSGVGQHVEVVGMAAQTSFLKAFVGMEVCWVSIMGMAKLSILLFFWRIFSITSMKWCIYVLMSITGLWYLGSLIIVFAQCTPFSAQWDPMAGTCAPHEAVFLGIAVPHIVTDFVLIAVPVPFIWRLKMPTPQKVGICLTFALGSLSIVASIIRLVITVAHIPPGPDITWNFVPFVQWSATELYTALGTANLPSLGPLVRGRWERKRAATPMRPLDDDASSLRGFKTPSASKSAVTDVRVVDSRDGHKGGFRVVEEEEGDEYAVTLREFASAA